MFIDTLLTADAVTENYLALSTDELPTIHADANGISVWMIVTTHTIIIESRMKPQC